MKKWGVQTGDTPAPALSLPNGQSFLVRKDESTPQMICSPFLVRKQCEENDRKACSAT